MNLSQVQCAACGFSAHILLPHLADAHQMTAVEYQAAHPQAPVFSQLGAQLVHRYLDPDTTQRPCESVTITDVMGWPKEDFVVRRFKGHARWVPPGSDDGYHYDHDCTLGLFFALERPIRNAVWLAGYSGTGKTTLVLNVCRRLNREVIRVNLDSSITRSDLIGDWVVREGSTRFQHGLLPIAMRRGAVLLLDEFDLGNPYILALFRPVLEDNPRLVILENGGEVITPHPDFRVIATANTWGNGDTSGLYGTTQTLSLADRQRFSLFLEMTYLKPAIEVRMLMAAVPDLDEDEAQKFVQVANAIRSQFMAGKIEEGLSPRQLINWAETHCAIDSVLRAAKVTFLRPLSASSAMAIRQIILDSGMLRPDEMLED